LKESDILIKILQSRIKYHRKNLNYAKKHPKMIHDMLFLEMNYSYIYHELKFIINQIKSLQSETKKGSLPLSNVRGK